MFYGRCFGVCAVYLIAAFITDLRSMKIPECFNCFGYAVRPCLSWRSGRVGGLLFSLKGLGAGFLYLVDHVFYRAVGAGDVKLFGALVPGPAYGFILQGIMYSVLLPVSSVCLSCSGVGKR